jgi:6,7-dimethyl-8-ribityllumazine synthase
MAEPRRDAAKPPERLDGGRILIVEARFYEAIGAQLLDGAQRAIASAGASFEIVNVPGALEIPIAIAIALDAAALAGQPYDGAVALGCVIRGETIHFEIVSHESARGLLELSVARKIPIGNGIITVENEAQAKARASVDDQDKGGGAVRAALALVDLKKRFGKR